MKNNITIWPSSAYYVYNDELYFAHGMVNGLFNYSVKNKSIRLLGDIGTKTSVKGWPLYSKIIKKNDFLIIVPYYANDIGIYNLKNNRISRVNCADCWGNNEGKLINAFVKNDEVFFVPVKKDGTWIKMSSDLREVMCTNEVSFRFPEDSQYIKNTCVVGDYVIGLFLNSDNIVCYNIHTNSSELIKLNELQGKSIDSLVCVGKRVYVQCSGNGHVYVYDMENWNCKKEIETGLINSSLIYANDETMYFDSKNKLHIVSLMNDKKYELDVNGDNYITEFSFDGDGASGIVFESDNVAYFYNRYRGNIVDLEKGEQREIKISSKDTNLLWNIVKSQKLNIESSPLGETELWGIRELLETL